MQGAVYRLRCCAGICHRPSDDLKYYFADMPLASGAPFLFRKVIASPARGISFTTFRHYALIDAYRRHCRYQQDRRSGLPGHPGHRASASCTGAEVRTEAPSPASLGHHAVRSTLIIDGSGGAG